MSRPCGCCNVLCCAVPPCGWSFTVAGMTAGNSCCPSYNGTFNLTLVGIPAGVCTWKQVCNCASCMCGTATSSWTLTINATDLILTFDSGNGLVKGVWVRSRNTDCPIPAGITYDCTLPQKVCLDSFQSFGCNNFPSSVTLTPRTETFPCTPCNGCTSMPNYWALTVPAGLPVANCGNALGTHVLGPVNNVTPADMNNPAAAAPMWKGPTFTMYRSTSPTTSEPVDACWIFACTLFGPFNATLNWKTLTGVYPSKWLMDWSYGLNFGGSFQEFVCNGCYGPSTLPFNGGGGIVCISASTTVSIVAA